MHTCNVATPTLCFVCVRLVRALLGGDAIADNKLEHGNPLTVLGISVKLGLEGIEFRPDKAKVEKWTADINRFILTGKMTGGEASKLAGAALLFARCAGKCILCALRVCVSREAVMVNAICLQESGACAALPGLLAEEDQAMQNLRAA